MNNRRFLRGGWAIGLFLAQVAVLVSCGGNGSSRKAAAVHLVAIEIEPDGAEAPRGEEVQFRAQGVYSDGAKEDLTARVTWRSSDPLRVPIGDASGNKGLAIALEAGTVEITASLDSLGSDPAELVVLPPLLTAIEITPASASLPRGTKLQLAATGIYDDQSTSDITASVLWESSDVNVAAFLLPDEAPGLVHGVEEGATGVTAKLDGITGMAALTVTPAAIRRLEPGLPPDCLAVGLEEELRVTGIFSDGSARDLTRDAEWTSGSPGVASVGNAPSSKGRVEGLREGESEIQAAFGDLSVSILVAVCPKVLEAIEVTPAGPSIVAGTQQAFEATGIYSDKSTDDVTRAASWKSSAPEVATVGNEPGSKGIALGRKAGSARISASLGGIEGSTELEVIDVELLEIEVRPESAAVPEGLDRKFTALGRYNNGTEQDVTGSVTWSSSARSVAVVSNAGGTKGLASAIEAGKATLTAALGEVSGTAVLTVTAPKLLEIEVRPEKASVVAGSRQQFSARGRYDNGDTADLTVAATWKSSDSEVAVVSNEAGSRGLARGIRPGTASISASKGEVQSNEATTVVVTQAVLVEIDVEPDDASIAAGRVQPFTATGSYSDGSSRDITSSVTWASSDGQVAQVSNAAESKGTAKGLNPGKCRIDGSLGGKTGSATLAVSEKVIETMVVSPKSASIFPGGTRAFTAMGRFSDESMEDVTQRATWSSSREAVATISNGNSRGIATAVAVGSTDITARLDNVRSGPAALTVTAPLLVSIEVTPSNPFLGCQGDTVQFQAFGVYENGASENITQLVAWSSSDGRIARFDNTQRPRGLATRVLSDGEQGEIMITATLKLTKGSTKAVAQICNLE